MPITGLTPRQAQQRIEDLASGHTGAEDEREIVELLEGLSDRDRGACLRLIDGGGDHHTLDHLLNDDVDDPALRARLAAVVGAAAPYIDTPGRFVVSDIDDTVKPSTDPNVNGTRYPGARAVFKALDDGFDGTDDDGDVHFVTARDGIFVHASSTLRATGIDYNSVRYGNTAAGLISLLGILKAIEEEKVHDVKEMIARNPSRQAVLVGDTVQADPAVYRRILNDNPNDVELVLLHEVQGHPCPLDMKNNAKVIVFADYFELGRKLFDRGVINASQLQDVLNDA